MEVGGNNRSVMPLDVLGRTRATLMHAASSDLVYSFGRNLTLAGRPGESVNVHRDRDWHLQFCAINEEFLVNASHQLALITSLPFVHTARRTYRSKVMMSPQDCSSRRASGFREE